MAKYFNRDNLRSVKLGARRAFQAKQRQAIGRQALADIAAGRSMADILMTATVSRATLYRAIDEARQEMEAPLDTSPDQVNQLLEEAIEPTEPDTADTVDELLL